jgi:predicted Zn-dependent protease
MKRFSVLLLLVIAAPVARAAVPVTDRDQALAFTAAAMNQVADHAYQETLKDQKRQHLLDRDGALLRKARAIAGRLIAQALKLKPAAAHWEWELHLTESKDVNAYAMAGGEMLVGAPFVRSHHLTDDELAILLGHEIGHVIAEHFREQATAVLLRNPKHLDRPLQDVLAAMDSDLSIYFDLLSLSRTQEIEADQIGVRLAAMAGFRPVAALAFYNKLANDEKVGDSLFDTHGSAQMRERIAPALVADSRRFYQAALNGPRAQLYVLR